MEMTPAIREKIWAAAERAAPIFKLHNWQWAGYGVPGAEDIAAELERQIDKLRQPGSMAAFGRLRTQITDTDELVLSLDLGDVYVGEDVG
jgi:hypothetical protein